MTTIQAVAGPSRPLGAGGAASEAPLAIVQDLIRRVARAFYEVRHVVVLDQLMRKEAMKDEELAGRLGLGAKDLLKASHLLIQHQLLSVHRRNEVKSGATKASARVYYYIDYQHAINVIKWRMWRLQKLLDEKSRSVMGGQGYVCPKCTKEYSTLDVGSLQVVMEGFLCEICSTVIVDNDNAEEVQKNKDRMQRFNQQSARIKLGLQKADRARIPPFDISRWLAKHAPLEATQDKDGLAIATGGAKEATVTVSMAAEGDEEAKRRVREAEAEAKRKANALPIWIAQSTISGDLTAAGVRESSPVPAPAAPATVPAMSSPTKFSDADDTKKAEMLDDDLDAYFAAQEQQQQQQRSEAASPALNTHPDGTTRSASVASSSASGAGASSGQKRSRDRDEGYASLENLHKPAGERSPWPAAGETADPPQPDPDESEARYGKKAKRLSGSSPASEGDDDDDDEEEPAEMFEGAGGEIGADDDRMVSCGGKMVLLRDLTDDVATALMTSDEYTAYIDLVMPS